jgi:hypothetical protein
MIALDFRRRKERGYGMDVFSYGVILWEVLVRQQPWSDWIKDGCSKSDIEQAVKAGERLEFPETVPEALQTFIRGCWHQDPLKRPTFAQLLQAISQIEIPSDWKDLFMAAGVKEDELTAAEQSPGLQDVSTTLLDVALTSIPLTQTGQVPNLQQILEAKKKLKPVQPGQVPKAPVAASQKNSIQTIIMNAIQERRSFIASSSSSLPPALWSK